MSRSIGIYDLTDMFCQPFLRKMSSGHVDRYRHHFSALNLPLSLKPCYFGNHIIIQLCNKSIFLENRYKSSRRHKAFLRTDPAHQRLRSYKLGTDRVIFRLQINLKFFVFQRKLHRILHLALPELFLQQFFIKKCNPVFILALCGCLRRIGIAVQLVKVDLAAQLPLFSPVLCRILIDHIDSGMKMYLLIRPQACQLRKQSSQPLSAQFPTFLVTLSAKAHKHSKVCPFVSGSHLILFGSGLQKSGSFSKQGIPFLYSIAGAVILVPFHMEAHQCKGFSSVGSSSQD